MNSVSVAVSLVGVGSPDVSYAVILLGLGAIVCVYTTGRTGTAGGPVVAPEPFVLV